MLAMLVEVRPMTWFGLDLPFIIGGAMDPAASPATLVVVTPGTRNPADPTAGTQPTTADVACRGIVCGYDAQFLPASMVGVDDRFVKLYASSLGSAVPKSSDRVTIEGETFTVVRVRRDAASVVYFLQVSL